MLSSVIFLEKGTDLTNLQRLFSINMKVDRLKSKTIHSKTLVHDSRTDKNPKNKIKSETVTYFLIHNFM